MNKRILRAVRKKPAHGKKQAPKRTDKRLFINHLKAWHDACRQILQTPISSLITCTVMAMTILLTTTMLVTIKTLQQVTHYINNSSPVTIYLKTGTAEYETNLWINKLHQQPFIKEITYISPQQALHELTEQADYKDILSEVGTNPLPPVILIKLTSNEEQKVNSLMNELKNSPLVSSINVDFDWLARLSTLIGLGNRISYALTIFLAIAVIFIISHAIQEATQQNQQEMKILLLMGASTAYIRRPFLYLGALFGLGAGLVTLFLLVLLFLPLKQSLGKLMQTYHLTESDWLFNSSIMVKVLLRSVLLGWFGAWLAFYRYARVVV